MDEKKAIQHYQCNIQISEAFYPCLSVLEVALRNAVNRELITKFGVDDWYNRLHLTPGLSKLLKEINVAQNNITKRKELINPSKVVAELTFGFWTRLFNSEFELILWKDLRRAFPFMPKKMRQRKNVSAPINVFRTFRNRVFHNEPICWNLTKLQHIHSDMIIVMGWINNDLPTWITTFDRFDSVLNEVKKKLK
ncbi:MAG TPA: hypothetical protein DG754_09970 [Bacteroidales bacterium]|nr:hypothetical protein [Bacteroidales bacterium]